MNIAFFFHDSTLLSGATRSFLGIMETLVAKKQAKAFLFVPVIGDGSLCQYFDEKGIQYTRFDYQQYWYTRSIKSLLKSPLFVLKTLKERAFCRRKVHATLRENGVSLIYQNTSVILAGLWASNGTIPVVTHFREFGREDYGRYRCYGQKWFIKRIRQYAGAVFISKSVSEKYVPLLSNTKCRVIPNDVDYPEQYRGCSPTIEFDGDGTKVRCLIAGNIVPGKGQLEALLDLLPAFERYPNLELFIAGSIVDQTYYSKIIEVVKANSLEKRVTYLGMRKDLPEVRKSMHVAIISSFSEGFGRVTIEALASGMIVFGFDSAGTSELIRDGENGFLYDRRNESRSLSAKLIEFLCNQEKYSSIRSNAIDYSKRFMGGQCAQSCFEFFQAIVGA